MRLKHLCDTCTYTNLEAHTYMNLKAQHLYDACFKICAGARVAQRVGSHILCVRSGLIKFDSDRRLVGPGVGCTIYVR
jgi:hypothetical protein